MKPSIQLNSWLVTLAAVVACGGCGQSKTAMDTGAVAPTNAMPMMRDGSERKLVNQFNTETYDSITENPFQLALSHPQSTFSIDVDTASYANVRRMLQSGELPPSGAVRIEELVNYFGYDYPEPSDGRPFSVNTELAACPWSPTNQLLRIGLKGQAIEHSDRPACNLVFLLDVSGSMMAPNKLPLVKSAMQLLTNELQVHDRVAIVVYAGASGLVLDSTAASDGPTILQAIEQLQAGGGTNGSQGIRLAYQVAEQNFIKNGINRVLLCTDGDFNVGITNQSQLVSLIQEKARSNVFLSVLGFGSGNLKDSTMEKLADQGNGNYSYIDSLLEARKVLVEQIGGTLITIAKDVKIQVDFNPRHVQSYRLLGYENRLLENQDFRDDSKDAGEIGAGHTVTAFYEIVPVGASAESPVDERPSEFVTSSIDEDSDTQTVLTVNLRYKQPEESESSEFQVRLDADEVQAPSSDFQFASAVAAYGMLLRGSQFIGRADWDWVVETAQENMGEDRSGLRGEFVQLAKTARRISQL